MKIFNFIKELEELDAKRRRKGLLFIIFFTFLLTFLTARTFVWVTHQSVHLIIKGYIIHHVVYGLTILAFVGGVAIVYKGYEKILAPLYGIGLGLATDEIGFLISWGNYWNRLSYDIVVILILVFLNAIFFEEFWHKFGRKIKRIFKRKSRV